MSPCDPVLPAVSEFQVFVHVQGYLKEILREVCTYNTKAPHRNMWELKPEYRHYKD